MPLFGDPEGQRMSFSLACISSSDSEKVSDFMDGDVVHQIAQREAGFDPLVESGRPW